MQTTNECAQILCFRGGILLAFSTARSQLAAAAALLPGYKVTGHIVVIFILPDLYTLARLD